MKKFILLLVVLTSLGLVMSACGKEFSIEGSWDVVDNKGNAGSVDFKTNGNFIMSSGMFQIGGNYTLDKDSLTLMYVDKDALIYELEIKDKESIVLHSIDDEKNRTGDETLTMARKN